MRVISRADGKVMRYSEELLSAFIDNLLQNPPDVLVIPGDLTFNGALQSHEDLARRLEPLQDAGIRVFVIPGNHDLRYSQAARFEGTAITRVQSPDAVAFEEIWHGFGLDTALSRDSHSLSYMAELSPGLRLLMLDVNTTAAPGGLLKETLSWAKQALLQARRDGARVISCSHQTLLQHNSLFEKGFRMENAEPCSPFWNRAAFCSISPATCTYSTSPPAGKGSRRSSPHLWPCRRASTGGWK